MVWLVCRVVRCAETHGEHLSLAQKHVHNKIQSNILGTFVFNLLPHCILELPDIPVPAMWQATEAGFRALLISSSTLNGTNIVLIQLI